MKLLIFFIILCAQAVNAQDVVTDKSVEVDTPIFRKSLYLFYNKANQLKFDSITISDGTSLVDGQILMNVDDSLGFGFDVIKQTRPNMGFQMGAGWMSKKLNSATVSLLGQSFTSSSSGEKSTFSFLTGYANFVYFNGENFYFPVGLNLSSVIFHGNESSIKSVKGGLGFQFGVGVNLTESFSMELLYKSVTVNVMAESPDLKIDMGNGFLNGFELALKANF